MTATSISASLADLENLARQAGEILRAGFGQHNAVYYKGEIDLVTDCDRRSEAFLVSEIRRRFPGQRIIAEESGQLPGDAGCLWYIDPLDGTVNFAHGIPIFTVSIGYAEQGQMRLGTVYDPMRDECFTAEAGRGAWLNGQPVHVSDTQELDQSLLITGFPYDIRTNPVNNLDLFVRFSLRSQGVRRLGSAAMDLCYVACGRVDGFWEARLSAWDIAAGGLIAREAGATVTNLSGEPDYLLPPCSILAAPPAVYPQMLRLIHDTPPPPEP
jgi:myo-inositol-1(or 4)-monophosphatase